MSARVRLTREQYMTLQGHLEEAEQVAFAFAHFADGCFDIMEVQTMVGDDIKSRDDRHVELRDDVRPRLISSASARGLSLVEAHSHGPHGYAEFSPSDLFGFRDWVPHLWWRLRGQPYAALVCAGQSWDGLAWVASPKEAQAVSVIEVTGSKDVSRIVPTGATIARLAGDLRLSA